MNSSQSSQFHYNNRDLITEIANSYVAHVISAADSMSGLTHTVALLLRTHAGWTCHGGHDGAHQIPKGVY